jgi:peptidase M23-like protein
MAPHESWPGGPTLVARSIRLAATHLADHDQPPVALSLPFTGSWMAITTPARRVPSHGTHLFGATFSVDFVAVDGRGRTAVEWDLLTLLATEPVERFYGFGEQVFAPANGRVVEVHDGEPDHAARRSPVAGAAYLVTRGRRLRGGPVALAGNYLILALAGGGPYVVMAHLRQGSLRVRPGDRVTRGQTVAACGNSGNSTQPHLHLQVMDSLDLLTARGLPLVFRDYLAWPRGRSRPIYVGRGIPGYLERVRPAPHATARWRSGDRVYR